MAMAFRVRISDWTFANHQQAHVAGNVIGQRCIGDFFSLNLEKLPGFRFSAVPPKFRGVGTFPVRAYARLPK